MPLVRTKIHSELTKIIDKDHASFIGFGSMPEKWSNAVNEYAKVVAPPSTTSSVAKEAFKTTMEGVTLGAVNYYPLLQTAFTNYAVSLASGMTGFVSTPPPTPIDVLTIGLIAMASGNSVYINALSDIIHAWFKTGTAVPVSGGPTINWK